MLHAPYSPALPHGACLPCTAAAEDGFVLSVLTTLGKLARVAGTQLRGNVAEILPLIIDVVQDASSPAKRLVAVSRAKGGDAPTSRGTKGGLRLSRGVCSGKRCVSNMGSGEGGLWQCSMWRPGRMLACIAAARPGRQCWLWPGALPLKPHTTLFHACPLLPSRCRSARWARWWRARGAW